MSQQDYGVRYNTYPVFSTEGGFDGSVKRFSEFPTPESVYNYALLGLPKYYPLTNEPITVESVRPFLESAITEIEMSEGMSLYETNHFHSESYIMGMFESNFTGIRLQQWPAIKIVQVQMKFPHSQSTSPYQTYTIPPGWVALTRNRLNVVASVGSVAVTSNNEAIVSAGGLFNYISGFSRGTYQPAAIEVIYTAGFENDKLPSSIADLIKTWAAARFLIDIATVIFPNSGVSVSIDGVAQSVQYNIAAMLQTRIGQLEKKKAELLGSVRKGFGRTMVKSFIGA